MGRVERSGGLVTTMAKLNLNSPLGLQLTLSDIERRRAIAQALRARESGGGQMVSGRYVPGALGALGGAVSRGLFGDPLDALQQEEEAAIGGYTKELAGATEGLLAMDPVGAPGPEFAQSIARAQMAGVNPDAVSRAMKQRESWTNLNRALGLLGGAPAPGAGGGAMPSVGRGPAAGAPPSGAPMPPEQMPTQQGPAGGVAPPSGGLAGAMRPRQGTTPLSGLSDGQLITVAAALDPSDMTARLAVAELKAREFKQEQGGLITVGGRPAGFYRDGIFVGLDGRPEDVTGALLAARSAAQKAAETDVTQARTPIKMVGSDRRERLVFPTQVEGYGQPPPGSARAAPAGGPQGRVKVNFEGTPDEVRRYVEQALGAASQPRPQGTPGIPVQSAAGGSPFVGPDPIETRQAESNVDTAAKARESVNADFVNKSYRPIMDEARGAGERLSLLDALDKLDLKTGWSSGVQATAARILTGIGMAPEEARQYAAKSETFHSVIGQQTWSILQSMSGVQTEFDAKRADAVASKITNTEQANKWIRALARAAEMKKLERAQFYQSRLPDAMQNGDLSSIEREWAQQSRSIFDYPHMQEWGEAPSRRSPELEEALQQYAPKASGKIR